MLTFEAIWCIIIPVAKRYDKRKRSDKGNGSIAQLGEHLPYKQRVIGSSPIVPTTFGPVVQLVRTLACHARGRRFEPVPGRQFFASVAQSVEQGTENPRVDGSIPSGGTKNADVAHLVERHLAKVEVAGSSPVIRSNKNTCKSSAFLFSTNDNLICIFESLQTETKATITKWEHSSAGRASALQAEGHRFESYCSHHIWPGSSVG